ncbi:MAG: hypothetical protein ACJ72Z_11275 [Pyrinomonadaceae bacterium]
MKHLVVLAFVLIFGVCAASAQEPTRVQFTKGKNLATLQGTTGNYGKSYVVRARSGQKIVLTLTPRAGVGIKVDTNGSYGEQVLLREEKGGTFEVGLEETGDYTIFLGSTSGRSAAFTLTLKIVKMTDI